MNDKAILLLADVPQFQLRARLYEQRIATGLYKQHVGRVRDGAGRVLTEEELLADEVTTMRRHIELAQEHIDAAKGEVYD
jgi:hypothetical protein